LTASETARFKILSNFDGNKGQVHHKRQIPSLTKLSNAEEDFELEARDIKGMFKYAQASLMQSQNKLVRFCMGMREGACSLMIGRSFSKHLDVVITQFAKL
jgi:hypothetical protein